MSEWTRPAQPVRCVVDLSAPLTVRRERGVLVQGDENANAIVVEVYQKKDVPYDLSGSTITLTFVRPDKLATPPISAEITGNVAVMTLTDICYRVSGLYAASVKLQKGNTERTIVRVLGDIISTENDGTATDEQILPTPEELLVMLEQVEQARNGANAAAENASNAADRANQASVLIENVTASATGLETGAAPTVDVTNNSGGKHFAFGIPKGEKGDPGTIENVTIESIEGLPKALGGKLPVDGTAADSSMLGGKPPEHYLPADDLLDNSDFTNPVYQAGIGGVHGNIVYMADRWIYNNAANAGAISYTKGVGMTWPGGDVALQRMARCNLLDGVYTCAVWLSDGTAHAVQLSTDYKQIGTSGYYASASIDGSQIGVVCHSSTPLAHIALFRGLYTADSLPPYRSRGYAAELAECQRYYWASDMIYASSNLYGNRIVLCNVVFPQKMRLSKPTITIKSPNGVNDRISRWDNNLEIDAHAGANEVTLSAEGFNAISVTPASLESGVVYAFRVIASADP